MCQLSYFGVTSYLRDPYGLFEVNWQSSDSCYPLFG